MPELTLKHLPLWKILPNDHQLEVYAGILVRQLFPAIEYVMYYIALVATVYYAWMFFRQKRKWKQLLAERELTGEKRVADVSFLRAQLSPHFIFNSLNFIYYTVQPHSLKAADAIIKLSELMRYTMREHKDGRIGLEDEVRHIQNYINLIQLRYEPEYYVEFEVMGDPENVKIPTMIFIPFVENAMKHGVVYDPENPVKIWLDITGSILTFTTFNLKSSKSIMLDNGVGIENVRKRLKLLYKDRHTLRVEDYSNMFKVVLIIIL